MWSAPNIGGLDGALADRFAGYRGHLETQPLAAHTRRTYAGQVGDYLSWLVELGQPGQVVPDLAGVGAPGVRGQRLGLQVPPVAGEPVRERAVEASYIR